MRPPPLRYDPNSTGHPIVCRLRDACAATGGRDLAGLLSEITASLVGMSLSIVGAKIQTSIDDDSKIRIAQDMFTIVDADTGLPVSDPRRLRAVEAALNHTLTTPAPFAASSVASDTEELPIKPPPSPPNQIHFQAGLSPPRHDEEY